VSAPATQAQSGAGVFTADGGTPAERFRAGWRKHRFWLLAGTLFVAVTVVGLVVGTAGGQAAGPLAVTNPAPSGGQAAATVLRNHGVTVSATDSLAATLDALEANGQGSSTVLLYDPNSLLKPDQVARLAGSAADSGAKLVALAPGPLAAKRLSPDINSAGSVAAGGPAVAANCANPDAQAAAFLGSPAVQGFSGGSGSSPIRIYTGTENCFAPSGKPGAPGILALNAAADVAVLGDPGVVSNQALASQGNAALVFRLLGSRDKLLWYTPTLKDVPVAAQPPSLAELTPQWILPASAWLLLVAVVGMFWRGRRTGPLVTEPLPVLVKASETVTGRARLYQDAKAVDTAARTLQHATLTRLARELRLGASAEPAAVVDAAAARTGRPRQELAGLLVLSSPRNEQEMVTMAAQLAAREEEIAQR